MPAHPITSLALLRRTPRCVLALALAASCAAAALAVQPHSGSASHLLAPFALRCDGKSAPLAIAGAQPAFSWQLRAASPDLHAVSQTAYELQVSAARTGFAPRARILWDSGNVRSSAISGIAYAGPALEAQHGYAWRVRVWDEHGRPSAWSSIAHWSQAPVWHAQWIEAPDAGNKDQPLPLFRKSFSLTRPVARAILYASGLGQDELRLNGRKVSKDLLTPGWSDYRKTVYYDSYDVTALLQSGRNALGIMLGNGMYRVLHTPGRYTKFVGSFGPPKCIVQLDIELAGGGSVEINSDGSIPAPSHFPPPTEARILMRALSRRDGTGPHLTTQTGAPPS